MQPPYPAGLVALLPEFLIVRRRTVDFVQRAADRHALDRPALMFAVNRELVGDWHTLAETRSPYATTSDPQLAAAEAARGAGLVTESLGRWALTASGRALCEELRAAAHVALAKLVPVPLVDLTHLADLCERAFAQIALAAEPAVHDYLPRTLRFRGGAAARHPLVALENAIHGLWTVRDDCHVAAWRSIGQDGPALDALTRLWRGEVTTEDELRTKLSWQRPADVSASLGRLRTSGLVETGEPLKLSAEGQHTRQLVEARTDRLFFTPWPDDIAAEADWIRDTLAEVNKALAA